MTSEKRALEFINNALPQLKSSGIGDKQEFIGAVLETFSKMLPGPDIPARDYGVWCETLQNANGWQTTGDQVFVKFLCSLPPQYDSVKMCVNISKRYFLT